MKKPLFNISELKDKLADQPAIEKNPADLKMSAKFLQQHFKKIKSLKALTSPPNPGEIFFLFTDSSFNAFTVIPYLIKEFSVIEKLCISTYSINKRILLSFMRLVDAGQIKSIEILVADSLKHQRPAVTDQLENFAALRGPDVLKVRYAWNHSKIALIRSGSNYFVFEGSGNWSENARHEQYVFSNSEELYRFRKGCIDSIEHL